MPWKSLRVNTTTHLLDRRVLRSVLNDEAIHVREAATEHHNPADGLLAVVGYESEREGENTGVDGDAGTLAEAAQNDLLPIHALLDLLADQRVDERTALLHPNTPIVSLQVPGRKVKPGMMDCSLTSSQRNLGSYGEHTHGDLPVGQMKRVEGNDLERSVAYGTI